ncbi:MAG: hypothetical protein CSA05_02675 [Bacteroidia bacterium]|nr:MAG: hypothetical protein CSA05_02675 [Bacteroidia bacterium]
MKKLLSLLFITGFSSTVSQQAEFNHSTETQNLKTLQTTENPTTRVEDWVSSNQYLSFKLVKFSKSEKTRPRFQSGGLHKTWTQKYPFADKNYRFLFDEFAKRDSLNALRKKIVELARLYLGTPYEWGGATSEGFDCSGFTQYLYNAIGIQMPRTAQMQSNLGETIRLEDAITGDLIFFGKRKGKSYKTKHLAIVVCSENGRFKMIHSSKRGVVIDENDSKTWQNYYKKHILFVKRIIDVST